MRQIYLLIMIFTGSIFLQCGIGGGIEKVASSIDKASIIIDQGIQDITAESSNWRSILERVSQDLPQDISSAIRNDAQNLVNRSIATAGTELRCNVDFLAKRAIASLRWLKAKLTGDKNVALPPPGFCQVTPDAVDLNALQGSISKVTIHGYDLDHADASGKKIAFYLLKANGQKEEIPDDRIGRTTHYQVTINLGNMARKLYDDKVAKIISSWNDSQESFPEVVILPWTSQKRTETVNLARTSFMPPKIGRGDGDFNTHDNEHMSLDARGEIMLADATTLKYRVYMHAREERSDWTEVGGYSEWATAYTAPPGWRIVSFRPNSNSRHTANIIMHDDQQYFRPAGEVVQKFQVWGDHDGDEAGTWTRVDVFWRSIEVTIEQVTPNWAQ